MAIKPHNCKKHGQTTAYVYVIKKGKSIGRNKVSCTKCRSEEVKRDWLRIKTAVIKAYGSKCVCCGENEFYFLTIDHINGNGMDDRKLGRKGWRLYEYLKKIGYPKEGYQLLCYNCNCSKGRYGICPHKRK